MQRKTITARRVRETVRRSHFRLVRRIHTLPRWEAAIGPGQADLYNESLELHNRLARLEQAFR